MKNQPQDQNPATTKRVMHAPPAWIARFCTNWTRTPEGHAFIASVNAGPFKAVLEQAAQEPEYSEVPCICPACLAVPRGWYEGGAPRYSGGLHFRRLPNGAPLETLRCLCPAGEPYRKHHRAVGAQGWEAAKAENVAAGEVRPMTLEDVAEMGGQFGVRESDLVAAHGRAMESSELPF